MINTMTFYDEENPPTWLDHPQNVGSYKWINGRGALPCNMMIIGDYPHRDEVGENTVFTGPGAKILAKKAKQFRISLDNCYFTNVLKFLPKGKNPKAGEVKMCMPILEEEIKRAQPSIIVCLGKHALRAIMGRGYSISDYRGTLMDHPTLEGVKVFATYNPSYILHNPGAERDVDADWGMLGKMINGEEVVTDTTEFVLYHTPEQVKEFGEWLFQAYPEPYLVLDCEWDGMHWMDPLGYLRTIQIGYEIGKAVILELYNEGQCVVQDLPGMYRELKVILEDPRCKLGGHHLRADGSWLLGYGARYIQNGIDVRPNTFYDTMVMEHTIDSTGPFGLTELTVKDTNMGRYDADVVDWVNKHKDLCKHGYGAVPRELLLPYGAKDVDAPRRIGIEQAPKLEQYRKPRDPYPSLVDIDMYASKALYELEFNGLLVDKERLAQMTDMYQYSLNNMESKVIGMASELEIKDFNHRSNPQVQKLLFDTLKMTPIKATNGRLWSHVLNLSPEAKAEITPTTNKETLSILADQEGAHPIVGLLRDIRKVDYVCKQWLVQPEIAAKFDYTSKGGGLLAKLWPDGRLHANFSQLKETARFGSSRPNVQNWMKRAEGELKRILGREAVERVFGAGAAFPSLRSIVVPTPGYVIMEADWKQAEMFVLAWLSGDDNMWQALITPGKDLHDLTAITAFGLQIFDESGNPVPDEYLFNMAKTDMAAFEVFQKQLVYLDQRGRKLTRKQFKDGIRVSAKNLNFGIPYGRGALDIAIQVKAETGTDKPIQELQAEIQQMMNMWKVSTYPDAWQYMEWCAGTVTDPCYLENPWGRRRIFPDPPPEDHGLVAKLGREAQNFPVQSTVADTCLITLWLMDRYRRDNNLHFRIINQIHDAVLVEVPEDEIEETKKMFYETMGNIEIKAPGKQSLCLDIDIDLMKRWGEKE